MSWGSALAAVVARVGGRAARRYLRAAPISRVRVGQWRADATFLAALLLSAADALAMAATTDDKNFDKDSEDASAATEGATASGAPPTTTTTTTTTTGTSTAPLPPESLIGRAVGALRAQGAVLLTAVGVVAGPAGEAAALMERIAEDPAAVPAATSSSLPSDVVRRCVALARSALPVGGLADQFLAPPPQPQQQEPSLQPKYGRGRGGDRRRRRRPRPFLRFGAIEEGAAGATLLPMELLKDPPIDWSKWSTSSPPLLKEQEQKLQKLQKLPQELVPPSLLLRPRAVLSLARRRHEVGPWEYPPLADEPGGTEAAVALQRAIDALQAALDAATAAASENWMLETF